MHPSSQYITASLLHPASSTDAYQIIDSPRGLRTTCLITTTRAQRAWRRPDLILNLSYSSTTRSYTPIPITNSSNTQDHCINKGFVPHGCTAQSINKGGKSPHISTSQPQSQKLLTSKIILKMSPFTRVKNPTTHCVDKKPGFSLQHLHTSNAESTPPKKEPHTIYPPRASLSQTQAHPILHPQNTPNPIPTSQTLPLFLPPPRTPRTNHGPSSPPRPHPPPTSLPQPPHPPPNNPLHPLPPIPPRPPAPRHLPPGPKRRTLPLLHPQHIPPPLRPRAARVQALWRLSARALSAGEERGRALRAF